VDGSFPPPDLQIWLEKFRSADWIVAVARYFERGLRQLGLTNISSIPNHVDLTRFAPAPKDPRLLRALGVTGDDIIVLHASKMVPRKRPLDIVAAAAETVRRGARMRYIVAGEGAESHHMEEACDRLRVADHFRFLGWVPYERMPSLFNLADIVVHPSEGEGLARVYLEAMACGRLLVASDIPAAREVVRHMETGLLFRKGDVGQLTAALLASQDAEVRATLGRAARESVEAHSLQAVTDRYVRVFRRVIAREREAHIVQP
jgi:glycosyltransferase involved in cell wall biosynthesis